MSHGLLGMVAQGMDGQKKKPRPSVETFTAQYPSKTWTWTVPESGWWRIVQWGPGANSPSTAVQGGGSGAHTQTVVALNQGQTVSIVVGGSNGLAGTVVTLPNGRVITAGTGTTTTGGAASNGDLNINGGAGSNPGNAGPAGGGHYGGLGGPSGTDGGAAGAPGEYGYRGGNGAAIVTGLDSGTFPGGGGGAGAAQGGDGFVMMVRQFTSLLY